MKNSIKALALAVFVPTLIAGCSGEPDEVSFKADVQPILQENCLRCHVVGGEGEKASGLNMTSYDMLMKGTKHGPIVKPGDALSSVLTMVLEGRADPRIKMPHGGSKPLSEDQIEAIHNWVAQGAKNN